jgi:hypothetical protein
MRPSLDGREFEFWFYRVSHGELLLRSPKGHGSAVNVDLVFVGVEYVDLPRSLPELQLVEPTTDDVSRAAERLGREVPPKAVNVLTCLGRRYLVVGVLTEINENELELFELPFD